MRVPRAAIPIVSMVLLGVGCAFPDYVFPGRAGDATPTPDASLDADVDGSVRDGAREAADVTPTGPDPTTCAPLAPALACATLSEVLAPDLEILDGKGDELCDLAPRTFSAAKGEHRRPTTTDAPQQVTVRVGVSARGVHFHVQVLDDPWLVVKDDLVSGDAIEIFVRGVHDPITGKLTSDGGRHFVFVPPTSGRPADGREVRSDGTYGALSASFFGIRGVRSGYEVELRLPWTDLGGQPSPGSSMGFDVGIDVSDDEAMPRRVQSFLHYQSPTAATTCTATTTAEPSCDDRTWCEAFAYHAP